MTDEEQGKAERERILENLLENWCETLVFEIDEVEASYTHQLLNQAFNAGAESVAQSALVDGFTTLMCSQAETPMGMDSAMTVTRYEPPAPACPTYIRTHGAAKPGLKAAGSCDVCRQTEWWFCECDEETERDNSPAPLRPRHSLTPCLLVDLVAKSVDPTIPRCPMCHSENTGERWSLRTRRYNLLCFDCNFDYSPQSRNEDRHPGAVIGRDAKPSPAS